MRTVKLLCALILVLNINFIYAQKSQDIMRYTKLHIQTGEGDNKKSGKGYFFSFQLTKDKTLYSAIIVDKKIINNATEIKLFLQRENNNEGPYILIFPLKADYIIQTEDTDLVAIPFWQINQILKEKNIKTIEAFLTEDDLSELNVPIKESDIDKLKKIWERKIKKSSSQ